MIVDPNERILATWKEILEKEGHEVYVTSYALSALNYLSDGNTPDIIFTEYHIRDIPEEIKVTLEKEKPIISDEDDLETNLAKLAIIYAHNTLYIKGSDLVNRIKTEEGYKRLSDVPIVGMNSFPGFKRDGLVDHIVRIGPDLINEMVRKYVK